MFHTYLKDIIQISFKINYFIRFNLTKSFGKENSQSFQKYIKVDKTPEYIGFRVRGQGT